MLLDPKFSEQLECGPENDRRIYHLAVPSVLSRAQWRKAVTAAGGVQYGPRALVSALRDGVTDVMAEAPEEARAGVLAKLDRHAELLEALGNAAVASQAVDAATEGNDPFTAALADVIASEKSLTTIEQAIAEGYPRYAAMLAADRAHDEIAGIVGARMFLTAWEGFGEALAKDRSGISEGCLALIPEEDFRGIGMKLRAMTRLSPEQRKNSKSPASSPSAGKISSNTTAPNGGAQSSDSAPTPNTLLN